MPKQPDRLDQIAKRERFLRSLLNSTIPSGQRALCVGELRALLAERSQIITKLQIRKVTLQ